MSKTVTILRIEHTHTIPTATCNSLISLPDISVIYKMALFSSEYLREICMGPLFVFVGKGW